MNDYIFFFGVLLGLFVVALLLIALVSIPIYIGTFIRYKRLSKVAKEFNLAYSTKFPSFWEFIRPVPPQLTIMFIEGKVNNHQVSIREMSGHQTGFVQRRYTLIEIDGKNYHDTLIKRFIFNRKVTTSVFKIRQILMRLQQEG